LTTHPGGGRQPNLRELLGSCWRAEGAPCTATPAGLQLLTHEQFDLVICDIFSDGNGLGLVRAFGRS
jgi:CheY-like chemotaxis protein